MILAGLAEVEGFALARGAALIARSDVQRQTRDLDFTLPVEEDRGFTPEMFAEMAGQFSRLRLDEFGSDAEQYEQLVRRVIYWQEHARSR